MKAAAGASICTICFEEYSGTENHGVCLLPCGHMYGTDCVFKWYEQLGELRCPQCKTGFTRQRLCGVSSDGKVVRQIMKRYDVLMEIEELEDCREEHKVGIETHKKAIEACKIREQEFAERLARGVAAENRRLRSYRLRDSCQNHSKFKQGRIKYSVKTARYYLIEVIGGFVGLVILDRNAKYLSFQKIAPTRSVAGPPSIDIDHCGEHLVLGYNWSFYTMKCESPSKFFSVSLDELVTAVRCCPTISSEDIAHSTPSSRGLARKYDYLVGTASGKIIAGTYGSADYNVIERVDSQVEAINFNLQNDVVVIAEKKCSVIKYIDEPFYKIVVQFPDKDPLGGVDSTNTEYGLKSYIDFQTFQCEFPGINESGAIIKRVYNHLLRLTDPRTISVHAAITEGDPELVVSIKTDSDIIDFNYNGLEVFVVCTDSFSVFKY